MPSCPEVQGPFWHLFLSALSHDCVAELGHTPDMLKPSRNRTLHQFGRCPAPRRHCDAHEDSSCLCGGRPTACAWRSGLYAPFFFLILAVKNGDSFSGNDWSQTQFPIFCTCCLFQFQIYTGMFHNALALFPCGFSSGSQPHTVKIMSWRSSFQWSVKDIKGHLKQ